MVTMNKTIIQLVSNVRMAARSADHLATVYLVYQVSSRGKIIFAIQNALLVSLLTQAQIFV